VAKRTKPAPKPVSLSHGFISGLYILSGFFILNLIWNHLNYVQIDLGGHLASGTWFQRGYYHQFQDANFLGYIHGLFYPPLEDAILATLNVITGGSVEFAFQVYLTALSTLYLASIYYLGSAFKARFSRHLVRILMLGVVWIAKPESLFYQGLSAQDLLVTGLSSQFLGMIFLFLLLREWLGEFRPRRALVYLSLCILSHIVVAMVALFVLFLSFALQPRQRRIIGFIVASAILVTSFYVLPFIAYKGLLTSSKILGPNLWKLSGLAILFLALAWRLKERFAQTLFLASALMTLPVVSAKWFPQIETLLPQFHYYRFAVFSLYLSILGISCLGERLSALSWRQGLKPYFVGALGLMAIFVLVEFSFFSPPLDSSSFRKTTLDLQSLGSTRFSEYGRYWVIGNTRSADFGIDSLLQARDPEFRSVKGLYWESSKNNLHLSSYVATLLSSPVVLDHFYYWGYNCEIQECVMEQFFRDYNIRGIIIPANGVLPYVKPERQACYQELLRRGETSMYALRKEGSFGLSGERFTNYSLDLKPWKDLTHTNTNRAVEVVDFSKLVPYPDDHADFFSDAFKAVFEGCKTGQKSEALYLSASQYQRLRAELSGAGELARSSTPPQEALSLKRLGPGRFQIRVPGDRDVLVRMKLNYYPQLRLTRLDGSEVPLYDAFPAILAYTHGDLMLEFKRSPFMALSYLISISAVLVLAVLWRQLGETQKADD